MSRIALLAAALGLLPGLALAADVPSNGWVVWASNRQDSRHEIYLMKADGSGVKRMTSTGGRFPAWSPDAKWIAYTHTSDSTTHVMRHDGTGDKKVCSGTFEFWLWDKSGLVCRSGDDHFKVNPDTGAQSLLFKKSTFTKIGSKALNPGGITHDGRYLVAHSDIYRTGFTGANGTFKAYHSAVILDFQNPAKLYFFGDGCEPTTPPSGNLVYHVCGNCSTKPDPYRMNLADLASRSSYAAEIANADANWGHEYFPRISNDNIWMVYGATTGCHDHDTCDYEIYVHRLGAGNSNRTRITTHSGNDQWPHLFVGTLPSFGCTSAGECDDGAACTADTCSAGKCQHTAISGCCTSSSQCDDANACTNDSCSANKCQHSAISGCCTKSSQCDDVDPCTADVCTGNKCQHSAISGCCTKSSQCDDANICTNDSCSANVCGHSSVSGCCATKSDCDDSNPCTADSCEVASGECSNEQLSGCCTVDTDCDDGAPCTLNQCDGNVCRTEEIPGCCSASRDCDDSNPCTADSCEASSGKCTNEPLSPCCTYDTDCDDADPCTLDTCGSSNECAHAPLCGDGGTGEGPAEPDAGGAELDSGDRPPAAGDGGRPAQEATPTLQGGCALGQSAGSPRLLLCLLCLLMVWRRCSLKLPAAARARPRSPAPDRAAPPAAPPNAHARSRR